MFTTIVLWFALSADRQYVGPPLSGWPPTVYVGPPLKLAPPPPPPPKPPR